MDGNEIKQKVRTVIEGHDEVKLVYLFGSRANGKVGPLSDYDFAVYLDEKNKKRRFEIKLDLLSRFSRTFGTDAVDVVVLNDTESPELKYRIISEGLLVYQEEPHKVILEPRIYNEYFDFIHGLRKYGLTKA